MHVEGEDGSNNGTAVKFEGSSCMGVDFDWEDFAVALGELAMRLSCAFVVMALTCLIGPIRSTSVVR
jgi:hypothetical protein